MPDSPFISDFRGLLKKHSITAPKFAHGSKAFNTEKPQCLYSGPIYDDAEIVAAVSSFVESRWAVAGESVSKFEKKFAEAAGHTHGVMVNSGSSANMILIATAKEFFGWTNKTSVITSAVGFPTTLSPIFQNGLQPILVDIEMGSLNIDVDKIEEKITPETRAIFLAPVLGNPPDMNKIFDICKRHNLIFLGDDCDSIKTKWEDKDLSEYAYASSCSFYPSHTISTNGGGIVTSKDSEFIRIARSYASWAKDCFCSGSGNLLPNGCCGKRFSCWLEAEPDLIVDHRYCFPRAGWNFLPLELQGAIGLVQLEKLDSFIEARRNAYDRITPRLYSVKGIRGVKIEKKSWVSWFGIPVIAETQELKEALLAHFERNGVQTRGFFAGNLLAQKGFSHLGDFRDYPNANQVLRKVFFIGANPAWTEAHFQHIEKVIDTFVEPV